MKHITKREYSSLEAAYYYFNERLFENVLPDCLIVLQRKANAKGYFAAERYENRETGKSTDEVALNPDVFVGRTDIEILSTLVHEQVHLWQYHFGKRPTKAYHDRQWADKMQECGLMPTTNPGIPDGKRTGHKMTHSIIPGGKFESVAQELMASGFKLNWQSPTGKKAKAKAEELKSKVKYSCLHCGQNAWAKPGAKLICGQCNLVMPSEDEN